MTKVDLIKMENGKKELPVGISKNKHGSYRLQRTVGGNKYRFGSIQNLELALSVNAGIDALVEDLRAALEAPSGITAEQVTAIVAEISLSNTNELTRFINDSNRLTDRKFLGLMEQNARLHDRLDEQLNAKKSFWQRLKGWW